MARDGFGVAKSCVRRGFVGASAADVKSLAERRFDCERFAVVMMDGVKTGGVAADRGDDQPDREYAQHDPTGAGPIDAVTGRRHASALVCCRASARRVQVPAGEGASGDARAHQGSGCCSPRRPGGIRHAIATECSEKRRAGPQSEESALSRIRQGITLRIASLIADCTHETSVGDAVSDLRLDQFQF
jgi:hypothetical protein